MTTTFPGQQTDEKVLYFAKPHPGIKFIGFIRVIVLGLLVFFAFQIISFNLPIIAGPVKAVGFALAVLLILIGLWWTQKTHAGTEVYITDRRVVKFAPVSPFHRTTRALFWDEAVKCKTYYQNPLLERLLGIGSLEIHARSQDKDNVDVNNLSYHEDLANYIDKILYTFKNKPEDLKNFKEFVAKPKGQRG